MDLNQVEIAGPCRITYKGIDLGHTLDGVVFTADRDLTKLTVDRYGSTPIDQVLNGTDARVKFKLAQFNVRNGDIAMPETSTYDGATNDRIDIGADAGASLRGEAGLLVIHPLKYAAGDLSHDINLYKAANIGSFELPFKVDEQLVIELDMQAFVDESYGAGRRLGHVGYAAVS